MKKVMYGTLFLALLGIGFSSCEKEEVDYSSPKSVIDEEMTEKTSELTFEDNVAILQYETLDVGSGSYAYLAEVKSFNTGFDLLPVYKFEGVEFCDNGLFNDEISDDGIYTSVNLFSDIEDKNYYNDNLVIHKNESFDHDESLNDYIGNNLNINSVWGVTIGCDVRLVPCPNTSWYNTSIFGEPCIEFTNCRVEIGFTM